MKATLREATAAEWDELLGGASSDYSLAQTFEFGRAIASVYPDCGFAPQLAEFGDGTAALWPLVRVTGRLGFLRRYVAMPLSLNGMPITVRGEMTSAHLAAMIPALRADSLQLNGGALDNAPLTLPKGNWEIRSVSTHVLNLRGGWDVVWTAKFSNKVRNQCRTAWKQGFAVKTAGSVADFDTYYKIYADSTRRWGYSTPPYPVMLFRALALLNGRGVELKLGLVDGRPVAGILLLHGRRSTLYWSGAMLKEFSSYSVNNGSLEVAIREACGRGAVNFDFGASGALESVRRFKEQFGAAPIAYQSLDLQSNRHRLAIGVRQRLALSGPPKTGTPNMSVLFNQRRGQHEEEPVSDEPDHRDREGA